MSDKGRKPEDRSKGSRASPVSSLPPLGSSATMMPHGSYDLTSSPHPLHAHHIHNVPFGTIIRPPSLHHMSPHIRGMTNDLGPPIFMPSLNLGVPKLQSPSSTSQANSSVVPGNSAGNVSSVSTSGPKTSKTSLSSQPSINTASFMPHDLMQFPSAFHPPHTMRAPSGQGHASYISVSAPPPPSHPSSMNMKLSSQSSSTIAKPTPIPASAASTGIVRPTPKPASNSQGAGPPLKQPIVSVSSKAMISSSSQGEVPSTSMNLIPYGYQQPHMMSYGLINASGPSPSHGQLTKILRAGSQQPQHQPLPLPPSSRSSKVDGSKTAASQVPSSSTHKSGGYIMDGYANRSSVGLSTSGQPTSTAATYMDTKMEHPPQPSAVPLTTSHPVSSLSAPSSGVIAVPPMGSSPPPPPLPSLAPPTGTLGTLPGSKDRPTTAEAAASNLIISKQALTGKQIASITGNTTAASMGQSNLPDSAYTSPVSNSDLVSSLGGTNRPPDTADFTSCHEQSGSGAMDWTVNSQQNRSSSSSSSSSSSAYLPPGGGMAAPSLVADPHRGGREGNAHLQYHTHHHQLPQHSTAQQVSLLQQTNGSSNRETVAMAVATSAPSSSFVASHFSGGGTGVVGSPGKSLTASPGGGGTSSSPRPHILRGVKRPHEGGWKENSHHSPGSSTFLNKLSNSNSTSKQKSSRQEYGAPVSPTSNDGGLSNHLSTSFIKSEPSDVTASPRKKPRKQNVIANDDRYASNVPDGFVTMATSEAQTYHEGGVQSGEELLSKPHPPQPHYNSLTSRNSRIKAEPRDTGGGKEMEVRYLSQLKKCPYPINGVYKVQHRAARNHFRRHADIKHREEHRVSIYELADDKSSLQRASGWKMVHFSTQLQEMSEVEEDILKTMQRMQDSVNNLDQTGTCLVNSESAASFKELVQGNIDRSSRVLSHFRDTRAEIDKVLEHKQQATDLLKKFCTSKPPTQSLLISSNHHKNCS